MDNMLSASSHGFIFASPPDTGHPTLFCFILCQLLARKKIVRPLYVDETKSRWF